VRETRRIIELLSAGRDEVPVSMRTSTPSWPRRLIWSKSSASFDPKLVKMRPAGDRAERLFADSAIGSLNCGQTVLHERVQQLPPSDPAAPRPSFAWLGPGVVMAASGIGASDIVCATVGGATYGLALLWALALGAFFKFVLSEGIARWQLATGSTALEGWMSQLPRWVMVLFAGYLVLWAVAVSGALVSGCGLAIENITDGAVPRTWGGFAQAFAAFALIWSARAGGFTRVMKPLIVVMFVSIVACAALTFREPAAALRGLFLPTIPSGGGAYVLSLIGGIGGSVTLLSYNYLLRDEGKVDPRNLRAVRLDLATAYLFTAIFGLSVMLIANRVFHSAGVAITDREAVSRMAGALAALTGSAGFYIYSIGFWAAVLASLVGVWQTIPSVFADCYSLLRRMPPDQRKAAMQPGAPPYRTALLFMALASVPFAFLGRPLLIVIAFTVLGSFFIPFLAATLLYLNNRVTFSAPLCPNRLATNVVLVLIVVLFLIVGALEIGGLFRR
jgi:Mn2+/Fe2+ NRAMP family transporter